MVCLACQLIAVLLFLMSTTHTYTAMLIERRKPHGTAFIAPFCLMTVRRWLADVQEQCSACCLGTAAGVLGHAVCNGKEATRCHPCGHAAERGSASEASHCWCLHMALPAALISSQADAFLSCLLIVLD